MPFLMFRDGIRTITIHRQAAEREICAFARCLAQATELDRAEQDLATTLWEEDFSHISYRLVDPLLDGPSDAEMQSSLRSKLEESDQRARSAEIRRKFRPNLDPGGKAPGGPTPVIGQTARQSEIDELMRAEGTEANPLEEFALILGEVIVSTRAEEHVDSSVHALGDILCSILRWGHFSSLAQLLSMLEGLKGAAPQRASRITQAISYLADMNLLRQAILGLDDSHPEAQEDLQEVLAVLKQDATPHLLEILAEAGGQRSRKCLLNVLSQGKGPSADQLHRYIEDHRWYVVRNIAHLAGRTDDQKAIEIAHRTMKHPDQRVRRETVRSLALIGGRDSLDLLETALADPETIVRTQAVRSLADLDPTRASELIVREIGQRDFASRQVGEVSAYLHALARAGANSAIQPLEEIWQEETYFFRKRGIEMKISALRALKSIGTGEARQSLSRAARQGDQETSAEARRLLRGGVKGPTA